MVSELEFHFPTFMSVTFFALLMALSFKFQRSKNKNYSQIIENKKSLSTLNYSKRRINRMGISHSKMVKMLLNQPVLNDIAVFNNIEQLNWAWLFEVEDGWKQFNCLECMVLEAKRRW